jgi:hypothetical protein
VNDTEVDEFLFRLRLAAFEGNQNNSDTLAPLCEENLERALKDAKDFLAEPSVQRGHE